MGHQDIFAVWWSAGTEAQCEHAPGTNTISSQMLCRACHDVLEHQVRGVGKEADLPSITFIIVSTRLSQGAFAAQCMLLGSC